jgi:hypothetical protein
VMGYFGLFRVSGRGGSGKGACAGGFGHRWGLLWPCRLSIMIGSRRAGILG